MVRPKGRRQFADQPPHALGSLPRLSPLRVLVPRVVPPGCCCHVLSLVARCRPSLCSPAAMPSTATASPAPRRGRRSSALLLLLCALLLLLSLRDSGAATAPSPEPTTNGQEQDEAAASSSSSPSSSALPLPPASSVWCPLSDDRSVQQLADELIAALDLPSPTDAASAAEAEAGRAAAMRSATAQFASHRCPPDMGDWIIDNPVPEQDVSALAYTSRDWLRWDGFDPSSTAGSDWFYTPPTFGETPKSDTVWGIDTPSRPLDLSLPSNVSTAARVTVGASGKLTPALYLRAVRSTFIDTFWIKAYKTFRSYSRNPTLDFVQQFHVKKDLDFIGPLMNASFAINENYNIFRTVRHSTQAGAAPGGPSESLSRVWAASLV